MTPSWSDVAKALSDVATHRDGEWCGFPMPLPGLGLVLEDKHPLTEKVSELQAIVDASVPARDMVCSEEALGWRTVNSWRCPRRGGTILVVHHEDGRKTWALDPDAPRRNRFWLGPLETLDAWNLDTECTAIDSLAELLSERMFKAYVLTGTFLETSRRSGLTYLFRRCRPTIVLSCRHRRNLLTGREWDEQSDVNILCALCSHPIGFYRNTFCGAMTPTDDVIAHLLLMRADEHMLWRRCNQHHPGAPEAGL
jgi:hypothetical protein